VKILDYESEAPPASVGDAIEIQSEDGDALFRIRLVGLALDVSTPPSGWGGRSALECSLGLMIISPVSSNRVIVRREHRERPRP
jgi:hypothetical protein